MKKSDLLACTWPRWTVYAQVSVVVAHPAIGSGLKVTE
jgi:hypothetical protein